MSKVLWVKIAQFSLDWSKLLLLPVPLRRAAPVSAASPWKPGHEVVGRFEQVAEARFTLAADSAVAARQLE